MTTDYLLKEETDLIIKAFYDVYNALGYGFLERVYQNALFFELCKQGFNCKTSQPINVYYNKQLVGEYYADIVVDNKIILELKAVDTICHQHELQLLNYLKATPIEVGLLLNFGQKPQIRRKIFTNDYKIHLMGNRHTDNTD
ncbi:MAG: GxxExxY protein [Tannerellaceae bacterium]|jgi:GxxExxY protein|nr:GxxExxY protein [Tannerellaceae bacterium]